MALDKSQLNKVANLHSVAGGPRSRQYWMYFAGADTIAQVAAAGYFNDVRGFLLPGDTIFVVGADGTSTLMLATVPTTGNLTSSLSAGSGTGRTARGVATTVTASDTIVTGLGAALGVVIATLADDPVAGCQFVTASIGNQAGAPAAGSFLLKTWKATATADTAQIAATTFGKKVSWYAFLL